MNQFICAYVIFKNKLEHSQSIFILSNNVLYIHNCDTPQGSNDNNNYYSIVKINDLKQLLSPK